MRLEVWRKRNGMSQTQVAIAIGVNQSTIARYERGEMFPAARVMLRIRTLMGADFDANDFYPAAADSDAAAQ